jgi:hypothetical protein
MAVTRPSPCWKAFSFGALAVFSEKKLATALQYQ